MILYFRSLAKGTTLWVVTAVIFISFTFISGSGFIGFGSDNSNVYASVGKRKIYKNELDGIEDAEKFVAHLAEVEFLKKHGFKVSNYKIAKELGVLRANPAFYDVNGAFDREKFQTWVVSNGVIDKLSNYLLVSQYKDFLRHSVVLTDSEQSKNIKDQFSKISFDILPIKAKQHKLPDVDAKELETYYNEHKSDFTTEEKLQLEYVTFDIENIKNVEPSDDEIKQYYQQNLESYIIPKGYQLRHILYKDQIQAKADLESLKKEKTLSLFKKLAKLRSIDSDTADKGGELGMISKNEISDQIFTVVEDHNKPGLITELVKSPFGTHLVYIDSIRDEQLRDLNDIYSLVKQELITHSSYQQFSDKLSELKYLSFEYSKNLKQLAEKMSLPYGTTTYSEIENLISKSEVLEHKEHFRSILTVDFIKNLRASEPIKMSEHKYYVVRPIRYEASQQLTYEQARESILNILRVEKRQQQLLAKARKQILDKTINFYDKKVITFNNITKSSSKLPLINIRTLFSADLHSIYTEFARFDDADYGISKGDLLLIKPTAKSVDYNSFNRQDFFNRSKLERTEQEVNIFSSIVKKIIRFFR